eukprot:scaffold526568_cov34-Prasinocladus_malaysianus.AAC.1
MDEKGGLGTMRALMNVDEMPALSIHQCLRMMIQADGLSDLTLTFSNAERTAPKPTWIAAAALAAGHWLSNDSNDNMGDDCERRQHAGSVTLSVEPVDGSDSGAREVNDLLSHASVMPVAFCSPGSSYPSTNPWISFNPH